MNVASLLARANERWPRRLAVVDGERRMTYKECAARAAALALRLSELGVEPGDRVALAVPNGHVFYETTFAVAALGAILVPINTRLAPAEQVEVLKHSGADVWIASADYHETVIRVASSLPTLARLIWVGTPHNRGLAIPTSDYANLAGSARPTLEPVEVTEDAVAQLYYTSGTTGRPKGVMLTHANLVAHAEAATSELEIAEDDAWAHIAPMFHLADAWATFAVTLAGGRHVMAPEFKAPEVLDLIETEEVTITNLVPTMLQRLLAAQPRARADTSHLRLLLTGGAPIAPTVVERVLEVFQCEYAQTYGMTETSPYLTLSLLRSHHWELSEAERLRLRARTGRPFETIELEVVDENGEPVPADDHTVGEIRVQGTTVSPGYWNDPERTAEAFRDGWLYTGDLAVIDTEGYVDIVDRKKDMILSGGETVYSTEVENALYTHPAVLEAAAYGVPDEEWGEKVCAAVVLVPEARATEDELAACCRERLAGYKIPRRIEILDELPKTGSGKIRKGTLRERDQGAPR
ncbi:MAG: long-chain-fatty-acid--CoA ligase [bacterium]|nr:long-chain-fatty-acid--CoA ligase [bacterium]